MNGGTGEERLWKEGRWEDLLGLAEANLHAAKQAGDLAKEAEALMLQSSILGQIGRHEEALQSARRGLHLRRQAGDAVCIARALAGMSAAVFAIEGPRKALTWFQQAEEAYRELEEIEERCHAAAALARVCLGLGRGSEAQAVLTEAIELCADDSLAWCKWMLLEIQAEAYRAEGEIGSAIRCFEEAFILRQREGAVTASRLRNLAEMYLEAGRTWEAIELFRMALKEAVENRAQEEFEKSAWQLHVLARKPRPQRGRLTTAGLKLPPGQRSH